jgi:hypothetical protein
VARRLQGGALREPGAPVYTRASFVTQAGNPGPVPVDENPVQGTATSTTAIESDQERAAAQKEADRKRR